jgi:deazaflavin-dependent oxidoreductase (nitroreductase family)
MSVYHKPSGMVKLINAFIGRLGAVGLIPGDTAQLQVKGRRSGEVRSNAVTWVDYEGQRYLVAPRGNTEWVRNVRAAGGEAVLKRRKAERVRLEEVPVEQRAPIIQAYDNKLGAVTRKEFGVEKDAPLEEFEKIAKRHPVFRIVTSSGQSAKT